MKKVRWLLCLTMLSMATTVVAHAADEPTDPYDLVKLDAFGSCVTDLQKQNAEMALSFLKAFSWWNMKDQMSMIGDDYLAWHSSIAGLLYLKPEYRAYLPFVKNGQWDKPNYVRVMAFLAAHNDTTQYKTIPYRVDCVGNDAVTLLTQFTGVQIRRDPATGCVTHGVPFGSPTNIQVEFKDYPGATPDAPTVRMISRSYSNLDDTASARVRDELARISQGPPNMPENPANCKTEMQIFKEFSDQLTSGGETY